jgi:predicted alpha-1,6-mannanase (GH76 family)
MKRLILALLFTFSVVFCTFSQIADGNALRIHSCYAGDKSLSTPHSSLDERADVILWTETNVPAQRWIASAAGENFFCLTNAYSGIPLISSIPRPQIGNKLIQKSNESESGKWEFISVQNTAYPNAFYIRFSKEISDGSGLYIEFADDGLPLSLQRKRTDADSLRQMWTVLAEDILPNRVTPSMRDSVMHGWKNRFYNMLKTSTGFWGEAEMMETILDAYETTGKQEYKTMFEEVYAHFTGTPAGWGQPGNGQDWRWNDFNDDIAWAVLASLRAYLMFGQHPNANLNYLTIAKNNYDWMYSRALLPSGMLRWNETPVNNQGSNSCINGPAEIAACYLAIATGDDSYYEKAKNLYALQRQYLYEPATGKVFDSGSWSDGRFTAGNTWSSTYNQGTFLGAALMLYNHYGTEQYKNDAHKMVEWTRNNLCNTRGVIQVCGGDGSAGGDLEGFKGILMRYLRRYIVDLAQADKVEWLQRNALQAYNNRNSAGVTWTAWWEKSNENFTFGNDEWKDKRNHPFGYSTAVSAAFNAPLSAGLIIKNALETIEAENFDYLKGVFVERSNDTTALVSNIYSDYYTAYNHVDFGTEQITAATFLVQGGRRGCQIEIRSDSLFGTLLGTVDVPQTGQDEWLTVTCPVTTVSGRHNIYLIYKNASSPGCKIDNFRFLKEGAGIGKVPVQPRIELYPNPALTVLTVNFPYSGCLHVYNSLGKEIDSVPVSSGTAVLDVNNYNTGIYIVRIITGDGTFYSKFLKN